MSSHPPDAGHAPLLTLSSLLGRTVRTSEGIRLGRLADLTVRLTDPYPAVLRMLVRGRRGLTTFVPWSGVERLHPREVRLSSAATVVPAAPSLPELASGEVLLRRDVLDTQVVDLTGLRLSRVCEVLLASDGQERLTVAAVDLGLLALLPRLGVRSLRSAPQKPVAWSGLHFVSPRAHAVQVSTGRAGYQRLDPKALAELLTRLSPKHASEIVHTLDPDVAATAVRHSHPVTARRLLRALEPEDARRLSEVMTSKHPQHTQALLTQPSPLHARRYLRTAGWRRLRPVLPPTPPDQPSHPVDGAA
jgi:hypothetical protein